MPPFNSPTFNSQMYLEAASAPTRRYRVSDRFPPMDATAPRSYAKRYGRRPATDDALASPGLPPPATVGSLDPMAAPELALAA